MRRLMTISTTMLSAHTAPKDLGAGLGITYLVTEATNLVTGVTLQSYLNNRGSILKLQTWLLKYHLILLKYKPWFI